MIEILDGLTGGAFAEIVETRDDDQTLAGFVQDKTDVAEIRVCDVLQLRQSARRPNAHHGAAGVKLAKESFDGIWRLLRGERDVNRGENATSERQQVRRKNELRLAEAGVLENFRGVAVREK